MLSGAHMPTLILSQVTLSFGRLEIVCEENRAVTLEDASRIFPVAGALLIENPDPIETADEICDILREGCELRGSHEHLFLLLYFSRAIKRLKSGAPLSSALLPLPKTRFSMAGVQNPLTVDFAFWTGDRFVVVFIRESPFDQHGRTEEALLKIWGFDVFCLRADEVEMCGLGGDTGLKILDALHLR
jgi:hypothetical protein